MAQRTPNHAQRQEELEPELEPELEVLRTPAYGQRERQRSSHRYRTASAPLPRTEGWLEKMRPKGHGIFGASRKWQRRYFLLDEGVLSWAHSKETLAEVTEARLHLGGAHVIHSLQSVEFELVPAHDVTASSAKIRPSYELRAANPEEARRWSGHIDRTVQQLQWRAAVHASGVFGRGGRATAGRTAGRQAYYTAAAARSSSTVAESPVLSRGGSSPDSFTSALSSLPPASPMPRHEAVPPPSPRAPQQQLSPAVTSTMATPAATPGASSVLAWLQPRWTKRGQPPASSNTSADAAGAAMLEPGAPLEPVAAVAAKLEAFERARQVGIGIGIGGMGSGGGDSVELVTAERRLLKEADTHEVGGVEVVGAMAHLWSGKWGQGPQRRRVFLFNDCVLVATPISDEQYQFQGLLPVDVALQVEMLPPSPSGSNAATRSDTAGCSCIRLTHPGVSEDEVHALDFGSTAVARDWSVAILRTQRLRAGWGAVGSATGVDPPVAASAVAPREEAGAVPDDFLSAVAFGGPLSIQVQGSKRWLDVYAYAREGYLRFYSQEADCPYGADGCGPSTANTPSGAIASSAADPKPADTQVDGAPPAYAPPLQSSCTPVPRLPSVPSADSVLKASSFREAQVQGQMARAQDALEVGDLNAAEAAATRAEELRTQAMGEAAEAAKAMSATEAWAQSLRTESKQVEGYVRLGQRYLAMGKLGPATEALDRALLFDPTNNVALRMRARIGTLPAQDVVLVAISMDALPDLDAIEYTSVVPGADGDVTHQQQITIRLDDQVFRLRPVAGTLQAWYEALVQLWTDAATILGADSATRLLPVPISRKGPLSC
jgi:tetratricopeptide (TPR) repeat protein